MTGWLVVCRDAAMQRTIAEACGSAAEANALAAVLATQNTGVIEVVWAGAV